MNRPRKAAAPAAEEPRGSLTIRVSADERAAWQRAAADAAARGGAPVTLGEWVRATCAREARRAARAARAAEGE